MRLTAIGFNLVAAAYHDRIVEHVTQRSLAMLSQNVVWVARLGFGLGFWVRLVNFCDWNVRFAFLSPCVRRAERAGDASDLDALGDRILNVGFPHAVRDSIIAQTIERDAVGADISECFGSIANRK